jgi:hypothetical protein
MRAVSNLKIKIADAKKLEESLAKAPPIKPEEIIIAPNGVFRQFLDVLAHDHAIEDAIYAVGKLFQRGDIDFQSYIRAIRSLSSEQFMKRALIFKIRQQKIQNSTK